MWRSNLRFVWPFSALMWLMSGPAGGQARQPVESEARARNEERIARSNEDLDQFVALVRGDEMPDWLRLAGQTELEGWQKELAQGYGYVHMDMEEKRKQQWGMMDLSKLYPHLDADVSELRARLPTLDNGAISWRLARIWASAHIEHNHITPDDSKFLPIRVEWLPDGPVVVAALPEYRELVGAPLIAIGRLHMSALLDELSPYLAYQTAQDVRTGRDAVLEAALAAAVRGLEVSE